MMKSILYSAKVIAALGIATALTSCGSGGGGDVTVTSSPTTVTPPSSTPEGFSRVDRTGQPAIATALLVPTEAIVDGAGNPINPGGAGNPFNNQRDQFNRGDPTTDAQFAVPLLFGPQVRSLQNIHFEVGPQLRALGLTLCSTPTAPASRTDVNIDACIAQVQTAPVVPDVITFNFAAQAGWPNGRHYDDPVVDRLLAVALLNLATPGQTINTFVGVINVWNGPTTGNASACAPPPAVPPAAPCPGGDETGTPSPLVFPYLRPAQP